MVNTHYYQNSPSQLRKQSVEICNKSHTRKIAKAATIMSVSVPRPPRPRPPATNCCVLSSRAQLPIDSTATLIPRLPVDEEVHRFHDWDIVYQKSHILHSMCTNERRCVAGHPDCCELCLYVWARSPINVFNSRAIYHSPSPHANSYESTLDALPHMPEMVFPKNRLRLSNRRTGAQLEFNALDALRAVEAPTDGPGARELQQVSCAEEWQESRPHAQLEAAPATPTATTTTAPPASPDATNGASGRCKKVRPYDWTYSTDYQGTVGGAFRAEPTDARLNIAKLMRQEHIQFYHDLPLYEDELHDHGIASCSVKIVSTAATKQATTKT